MPQGIISDGEEGGGVKHHHHVPHRPRGAMNGMAKEDIHIHRAIELFAGAAVFAMANTSLTPLRGFGQNRGGTQRRRAGA